MLINNTKCRVHNIWHYGEVRTHKISTNGELFPTIGMGSVRKILCRRNVQPMMNLYVELLTRNFMSNNKELTFTAGASFHEDKIAIIHTDIITKDKAVTFQSFFQVCLVNDPRPHSPFGKGYTVEYLGNVVGGQRTFYNNQPIEILKAAAAATLMEGEVLTSESAMKV